MTNNTDFTGQVVVFVGAGNGIGRASLKLVADRGGRVIALDNNKDALTTLAKDCNLNADQVFTLDVSQEENVRAAIATIFAQEKRIDALVNSAGMTGPTNR